MIRIQYTYPHIYTHIYLYTYTPTHHGEREAGTPAPQAGEAGAGDGGAVHDGGEDIPRVAFLGGGGCWGLGVG